HAGGQRQVQGHRPHAAGQPAHRQPPGGDGTGGARRGGQPGITVHRPAPRAPAAPTMDIRRLKLLSANIQAGSSTRGYSDYVARSWSHVLPTNKRGALDQIAKIAGEHDIVGLQESDPGSLRSSFTNQTHYLAERGGFDYWSHQPNRSVGGV